MSAKTENPWHIALQRLEAARAEDWSDTHKAQAAWEGIQKIEARLFKPATTMQELADKLRYLLGVSLSRADRTLPVARWPWKQRLLISAITDLDRLEDNLRHVRLDRLGKEAKRCRELIQSVHPLEEMRSQLREGNLRLEEIQAERDAARSALARFNLGVPSEMLQADSDHRITDP